MRSELEAGEKQGQGSEVEEEVIKFPCIICTQFLLPLNHCAEIAHNHLQEVIAFVTIVPFTQEFAWLNY